MNRRPIERPCRRTSDSQLTTNNFPDETRTDQFRLGAGRAADRRSACARPRKSASTRSTSSPIRSTLDVRERRLVKDECDRLGLPIVSLPCVAVGLIDFNASVRDFHIERVPGLSRPGLRVRGQERAAGDRRVHLESRGDSARASNGGWASRPCASWAAGPRELGLEIALELEPFPLSLINNVDTMDRFLDDVDLPNVLANLDISHLVLSQVPPEEIRRLRGPRGARAPVRLRRQGARRPAARAAAWCRSTPTCARSRPWSWAIASSRSSWSTRPSRSKIVEWVAEAYRETDKLMQAAGIADIGGDDDTCGDGAVHEYFMRMALAEAEAALAEDEVPVGAVIVHERAGDRLGPQPARAAARSDGPRRDDRHHPGGRGAGKLAAGRAARCTSRSSPARCAPARSCKPGSTRWSTARPIPRPARCTRCINCSPTRG